MWHVLAHSRVTLPILRVQEDLSRVGDNRRVPLGCVVSPMQPIVPAFNKEV
jgi:hypothetical protein